MTREQYRLFVWEIVRCFVDQEDQARQMVERSSDWRNPKARRYSNADAS